MKKRKQPKTHFVPKIVFEATFAGVVPVCVAASSCGGAVSEGGTNANFGADVADSAFFGVGDGVADRTFADRSLGVADTAVGIDVADAGFVGVADHAFVDRSLGVADIAFQADVADIGFGGEGVAADAFGQAVADVGFQMPDASDGPAIDVAGDAFGSEVADSGFGNPDGETG